MNCNKKTEEEKVSKFVERNEEEEGRDEIDKKIILSIPEIGAGIPILIRKCRYPYSFS